MWALVFRPFFSPILGSFLYFLTSRLQSFKAYSLLEYIQADFVLFLSFQFRPFNKFILGFQFLDWKFLHIALKYFILDQLTSNFRGIFLGEIT